jgi:RNA polymerase sigma-70 factor (ECF subfamily)
MTAIDTATPVSDESLLRRVADGDRLAMQALYARHHLRVYRFALRLVRNEAAAEDVASDVFIDVWRQADSFEGRSTVSTWLLGMTRFKALSALRRRQPEPLDDDMVAAIADPSDDPEAVLADKTRGGIIRKCMARLSPEHREITDLVYYHEKSIEEVARIVNISTTTVKTRMYYARRKLAELLRAEGIVSLAA